MTPIIWHIATATATADTDTATADTNTNTNTNSNTGASLAADQCTADAFGVLCCTVDAGSTDRPTKAFNPGEAMSPSAFQNHLSALAANMPPRVIKTGRLGSADHIGVLARFVDKLREERPVALVLEPVLRANTDGATADAELRAAYCALLLPRATVITANQAQALALLGGGLAGDIPAQSRALRALGCESVVITGGHAPAIDHPAMLSLDWLDTPHAQGWLSLPREAQAHKQGAGGTFALAMSAALALGWVLADAAVLAKMATTQALRQSGASGRGTGQFVDLTGFGTDPSLLPRLSIGQQAPTSWTTRPPASAPGVYAIVDSAERVRQCVGAGARTVQLRIKRPPNTPAEDPIWRAQLAAEIQLAQTFANAAGALLYINDHWQHALANGARALHLGQEDLLALRPEEHAQLALARSQGVALGLSSHSLWELCRAHSLLPDYVACGPVWPTTTKDMPWHPQGLDNLAWWAHMAPAPVVAIGGILTPEQLAQTAACGAAGGCVVRGLGDDPARTWPIWQAAWNKGQAAPKHPAPAWPHPSL